MDAREEISRWLALLVQLAGKSESEQIDGDIKMLTGVALQLSSELAKRNSRLARQCRPSKHPIVAKAPQSGPEQRKDANSNYHASGDDEGSQKSQEGQSHIMQGVRQAEIDLDDEDTAAASKAYNVQDANIEFQKAAKAIAR